MELDIAICMRDWPTLPKMRNDAIQTGVISVKEDNRTKPEIINPDAIVNTKALLFYCQFGGAVHYSDRANFG